MENIMDLVKVERNKTYGLVVSSRVIAKGLGKRHDSVLRDIDNIMGKQSPQICGDLNKLISTHNYKDSRNRKNYLKNLK